MGFISRSNVTSVGIVQLKAHKNTIGSFTIPKRYEQNYDVLFYDFLNNPNLNPFSSKTAQVITKVIANTTVLVLVRLYYMTRNFARLRDCSYEPG